MIEVKHIRYSSFKILRRVQRRALQLPLPAGRGGAEGRQSAGGPGPDGGAGGLLRLWQVHLHPAAATLL